MDMGDNRDCHTDQCGAGSYTFEKSLQVDLLFSTNFLNQYPQPTFSTKPELSIFIYKPISDPSQPLKPEAMNFFADGHIGFNVHMGQSGFFALHTALPWSTKT